MTSKPKILLLSHSAAVAGAEMCLLNNLRYLRRERWEPIVVLPNDGLLRQRIDALAVRTLVVPMEWWVPGETWQGDNHLLAVLSRLQDSVDRLSRVIEEEDVAIVQTNSVVTIDGALAAAVTGRPHIWHLHENLLESEALRPYLSVEAVFRVVELLSDVVVAVSAYHGERLRSFIAGDKLQVIVSGIPVEDFASLGRRDRPGPLRQALGCNDAELLVGVLASITRRKNPDTFVDVAARVLASRTGVTFVWVGNLTDREVAEAAIAKAARLGLGERVRFVGYQESVAESLRDLDVVTLLSSNENLSLACIEAMAAGRPVVSTRSGGPAEVIVHGETGFLVPVGEVGEMAARVEELLGDQCLRAEMGARGRQRALEHFDATATARRFEALYERLLALAPGPSRRQDAELIRSLLGLLRRAGTLGSERRSGFPGAHLRAWLHRTALSLTGGRLGGR